MGDVSLLLKYVQATPPAQYTPERFGLPEDAVRMVQGLLRTPKPCNILLHGVPGTGKTEFAKAVARACGKQVYFVAHAKEADRQNGRVAVEAVSAVHLADKAVVVVDEADELLNLRPALFDLSSGSTKNGMNGKSWLNEFLDRSQAQIIWITNKIAAIDASSMRRFDYDIPFRQQSARRRQEIWQEHLRESPLQQLITPADVAEMARKFRVGAAGIANAVSNAARIVPSDTADRHVVLSTLRDLLTSHERLTGGDAEGKLAGLPAHYDPMAICTDVPAHGIVTELKSCVTLRRTERPAANLLFWGPPGTGKTAFAQYLAQSLDKELIVRRASDLLSMFVGGTEHNIREAFEQADQEDAILLLDEADSFFIDRTRAQRSWETSQTNELLTQMENHHGILICCTNQLASLDHAVLRRFAWKVRFQAPTAEGRLRIYRRYFDSAENPVSAACLEQVARMESLTPGDMKAVWVRFRFRPAAEWNHAEIVQALAEEVAYRGQNGIVTGFQCQTQT
jgi:SpoVK/Ycf46/Vps4 family AAA+-type ATPase